MSAGADAGAGAGAGGAGPAGITILRRVEWMDTDAAGIWHWTTAMRFAEAAEAELHTALGIEDRTFGLTPRLAVAAEFRASLRFNDLVRIEFGVERVGRTSVAYAFTLARDGVLAAEGSLTACLVDREGGRARPWPDDLRAALEHGGRREPAPRG